MILKGSNRPKLDAHGFVEATIESIDNMVVANEETGEVAYERLNWTFAWQGTQGKEGRHHLQTGEEINPPDEEGVCNRLTDLCLRLGLITREELDDPTLDTNDAVGLRVRYKMLRNEKKQYIMNADTIERLNGKGKDKR